MITNEDGSISTVRAQPIKYLTYNQREEKIEIVERNSPNLSSITASSMLSASTKLKKVKSMIQAKSSKAATVPAISTTEPLTKVKTDGHISKTKTKIITKQPKTSNDSDRPSDPRQAKFESNIVQYVCQLLRLTMTKFCSFTAELGRTTDGYTGKMFRRP